MLHSLLRAHLVGPSARSKHSEAVGPGGLRPLIFFLKDFEGGFQMIQEAIERAIGGVDLGEEETYLVVKEVIDGKVAPVRAASLLTALRIKGVGESELAGATRSLRRAFDPWKVLED